MTPSVRGTSPGTAGQALVNEIASWSEDEFDAIVAAAFAKCPATGSSASACTDQTHAACAEPASPGSIDEALARPVPDLYRRSTR